jgi:hypothetical protein
MSSFDYSAVKTKMIIPALKQYGARVTLRSFKESFNAATGAATQTPKDLVTNAIIGGYRVADVDGTSVLRGDRRALVSGVPEPAIGSQLIVMGTVWTVVNVSAVAPGGVVVAYELQVRK